jgi:diguanylate cyclase (GGDEF)-like protein/putative nucleotidyltransferase with HDIG domain
VTPAGGAAVALAPWVLQRPGPLKPGLPWTTTGTVTMLTPPAAHDPFSPDAAVLARLDDAIAALGDLPVLDRTIIRVRQLAEDPEATTHELVATLESDPALAANVLRFANSAHCAVAVRASTLRQAVTLIGRSNVGRLALEAAVCRFFERAPGNGRASRGALHVHASQVATCATALARRCGADAQAAHLGGLLHDLGKLVLPLAFGEEALDALALEHPAGAARVQAERARLGADHAQAGARFAERADLDDAVRVVIAAHHGGPDGTWTPTPEAACVQAADCAVRLAAGADAETGLLEAALARLGLDLAVLDEVVGELLPGAGSQQSRGTLADRIASLERESRDDELTGVLTRRHWTAEVRGRLAGGETGSVLICDVDHFKTVNDDHGHLTGDLVLTEVARVLQRHGLAGRLGGDEFVLYTAETGDAALRVAEAILREIRVSFGDAPEPSLRVAVSIGLACAPGPASDLSALMRSADDALYDAKRAGRGRVATAAYPGPA